MSLLAHRLRRAAGASAVGLSFVDWSSVTDGASISPPAGAAIGDVAYLFDYAKNNGGGDPTAVTPSGWTNFINDPHSTADARFMVSRHILTSTSAVSGMTGTHGELKVMAVFRHSAGISAAGASDIDSQDDGPGDIANQAVTASTGTAPLIVFGGFCKHSAGSSFSFSTASPAFDDQKFLSVLRDGGGAYIMLRVGYKLYSASPADHTIGMPGGDNNEFLGTFYSEIS